MSRLRRLQSRYRLWRALPDILNRRSRVEQQLRTAAAFGGLCAEDCRKLAQDIGIPSEYRK